MNKKTRTILISIAIILIIVAVVLFFLQQPGARDGGRIDFPSFFPFGDQVSPGAGQPLPPDDEDDDQQQDGDGAGRIDQFIHVTDYPVAGYTVLQTEREGSVIRVVNARNGHVRDVHVTQGGAVTEEVISNTTIPNIEEAYFFGEANDRVLLRYADGSTIKTYLGTLPSSNSAIRTLEGTFMADDIASITPAADSVSTFYFVTPNENGARVHMYNLENETSISVFTSPAQEIYVHSVSDSVYITPRPTGYQTGRLFELSDGAMVATGQERPGIVAAAQSDDESLLVGSGGSNAIGLTLFNTQTGGQVSFGLNTLPEKCTREAELGRIYCSVPRAVPEGVYPDDWYQDQVSFGDSFHAITTRGSAFNTTMILNPYAYEGELIDGVSLSHDQDSGYLFIKNKRDGTLWALRS